MNYFARSGERLINGTEKESRQAQSWPPERSQFRRAPGVCL